MGAYNMGWGMRCDLCEEQLFSAIEGDYTKAEIEREAKRHDWIKKYGHWFCGQYCLDQWASDRPLH